MPGRLRHPFAPARLGRALAVTGVIGLVVGYGTVAVAPSLPPSPLMLVLSTLGSFLVVPSVVLLVAAPIVGLVGMRDARRASVSGVDAPAAAPPRRRWSVGLTIVAVGFVVWCIPMLYVLDAWDGRGDFWVGFHWQGLMVGIVTAPLGFVLVTAGTVVHLATGARRRTSAGEESAKAPPEGADTVAE